MRHGWLLHAFVILVVLFCVSVGKVQAQSAETDSSQPTAVVDVGYFATVRLTYYLESGLTFGGGHTYPGSTACSWNFSLGSQFEFPNGETFTCNDRGQLGSSGWLDLFRRPDLAHAYGSWVTVRVL